MKTKHGDKIKKKILEAGLSVWPNVTPSSVARAAGLKSHASVLYYFHSDKLKDFIAEYAVQKGDSCVIVQLLAIEHSSIKLMKAKDRLHHYKACVQHKIQKT